MTTVASGYAQQTNDLYETERWAILALLRTFPGLLDAMCWEPSAGNHKIADVIEEFGTGCYTSDIEVYDREHDWLLDFFDAVRMRPGTRNIVTNPPYGKRNHLATKYARHALQICDGWVALLLTVKFDSGNTRSDLFQDNPRFRGKLVLTDRIRWFGGEGSKDGTEDHAWFIWGPAGVLLPGPPTIRYARNPERTRG